MRRLKLIALCVLVLFAVTAIISVGGCMKKPAPKPLLPGQTDNQGAVNPPARMIIGYYENPWPGTPEQSGSFPSMKTYGGHMTHVVPFWYKVVADGTLESKESQQVYDTARNLGLKIFPLITYKTGVIEKVLSEPALRTKTIDNIVKLVKEKPYDGVNIDFELLKPEQEKDLTAFMAELYGKLKPLNKTVTVSVFPKIDVHESIHGAYNYAELAKNSDFIQVMLYDKHWATSEPGAIAPIDWYEKNIKYSIEQAGGANKVIAGVSAYGYDWGPGKEPAKDVRYVDAIVTAEKNGAKIEYDEASQAPHFKYKDHEIWFENDRSTAAKMDIVAKYNPAGIAIWRLGQEQPEIWPIIDKKFPKGQH